MLDEYTDEFSTNLDKHTIIQPRGIQPEPQSQPQFQAQTQPQYQQPASYQAPIYQQHVYQQPVYQTPTGSTTPPQQPQNIYQPPQDPGSVFQPQGENTRINNVFSEESKELNDLLKAEQGGGCLKTGLFILICILVIGVSFWASFTLGAKVFFPDSHRLKSFFPTIPQVAHKVKQALSASDVIKVETEFKHDLAAEPTTPILPPEVRPQPVELKPVVKPHTTTTYKKPKPLAPAIARAANAPLKKGMYRVVAGAYTTRKEAEDVLANIKADGFQSYVYGADNKYRIQIGAFKTKVAAEELRKKALEYGYNAFVSIY
jgi:hypothetical protein